ncbi:MAG: hypothetical protein U0X87_01810 [Anaerolineales bacterium]
MAWVNEWCGEECFADSIRLASKQKMSFLDAILMSVGFDGSAFVAVSYSDYLGCGEEDGVLFQQWSEKITENESL